MENIVTFHKNQNIETEDFNNMGAYARASLDHIVKDGIDAGQKYTGFPVTSSGPLELTVGAGRYYKNGEVYYAGIEGGIHLSFVDLMPAVTKKIITVAVWGQKQRMAKPR